MVFYLIPVRKGILHNGTFVRTVQYTKSKDVGAMAGYDTDAHRICWETSVQEDCIQEEQIHNEKFGCVSLIHVVDVFIYQYIDSA